MRVQIRELQVQIHDFKFTSYECKSMSYKSKFVNSRIIKSMKIQVNSLQIFSFPKILSLKLLILKAIRTVNFQWQFRILLFHYFTAKTSSSKQTLHKMYPYQELFWSAFSPHFPAFGLNTERYCISPYSVRMRENAGKMRTRITPNTDSFYAKKASKKYQSKDITLDLSHVISY